MKNIPTIDYGRGLTSYKLDTLMTMERDYKAAIQRGEKDIWTVGRHLAVKREIERRKKEV